MNPNEQTKSISSLVLAWAGLLASGLFVIIVAVGIATTPGFNAVDQVISTLYESGSPNGGVYQVSFIVYNILLMTFGVAVALRARSMEGRKLTGKLAGFTLVLTSIAGIIDDLNPQDRIGAIPTATGILHWQSTAVAFILMVLSIGLITAWFWRRPGLRGFAVYSLATLGIVIASGFVGGAAMSGNWPYMGIYETITMICFLVWLAILSMILTRPLRVSSSLSNN